jgi:hypothetical protein
MPLFTRPQYEQLLHNGSLNRIEKDPVPVVKLHLPGTDCIWLLTELDPDDPLMAFGLSDLGMQCPEMCPIDLCELMAFKLPLNITLEQDEAFIGLYPISVYAAAARACGFITEDQDVLRQYQLPRRRNGLHPI